MINHLPHGKTEVKRIFTGRKNYSCYHPVMDKIDAEINEILLYIAKRVKGLDEATLLGEFAKEAGFKSSKNLNDFLGYAQRIEEGTDNPQPKLRTVYRLLRTFLGRPPIEIEARQPVLTVIGKDPGLAEHLKVDNYFAVPMVEDRIAAGQGRIVSENVHDMVWVYRHELGQRQNHELIAVKLANDAKSMEPTLHPGDIIILDRDDKEIISPQGVYAVRTELGGCAVKRIRLSKGKFLLVSDNPDYPPEISEADNLDSLIIGRVVWSWTSWIR
jgi:SOS-response transcriptional repressor LexA